MNPVLASWLLARQLILESPMGPIIEGMGRGLEQLVEYMARGLEQLLDPR